MAIPAVLPVPNFCHVSERYLSGTRDLAYLARLERQVSSALACLEAEGPALFLSSASLTAAAIIAAVVFTHLREKLPRLVPDGAHPALEAHRAACETLPAFRAAPHSAAEAARLGWKAEAVFP